MQRVMTFGSIEKVINVAALATGLLVLIIPASWAHAIVQSELMTAVVDHWPKLKSDAEAIARYSVSLSLRYQLSYLVSVILFPALGFIAARQVYRHGFVTRPWPAFVSRSNLYIMPALLLFVLYFAVFDHWMAWSDARVARGVFRTFFCVWWPPVLLACVAIGVHRLMMNIVAGTRGL